MAYISAVVEVHTISTEPSLLPGDTGKKLLHHDGIIPANEPIDIILELKPDGKTAEAISEPGTYLIAGELRKHQVSEGDEKTAEIPVVRVLVASPAAEGQFLNEVSLVGRTGGEAKEAGSGKSSRVGVAVNRYRQVKGKNEPEELTDWYGCRGFGYTKEKLEKLKSGSLVEVQGCLSQLHNRDGQPYFELTLRSIRSHGKGSGKGAGAGSAPKESADTAGYGDFEENPEEGWD